MKKIAGNPYLTKEKDIILIDSIQFDKILK